MRPAFLVAILVCSQITRAQCISQTEAEQHIGEIHCVSGKIYSIERLDHDVTLLNFCPESPTCPFARVVFARSLKNIGDVRALQGRTVDIHGKITAYNGRAEIIIERTRQIAGEGAKLPAMPKEYDAEKKGHYSAGTFSLPHASHPKAKKKQPPTYPVEIPEDPE